MAAKLKGVTVHIIYSPIMLMLSTDIPGEYIICINILMVGRLCENVHGFTDIIALEWCVGVASAHPLSGQNAIV